MDVELSSFYLKEALEQGSQIIHKQKSSLLFRRGDKAAGMFVVLSGRVILDCGVDSASGRCCGPGALVGLPSTLTGNNYSMTATVTEDAELSFWSRERLSGLLRQRPELCRLLVAIMRERIAESQAKQPGLPSEAELSKTIGEYV